MKIMKEASWFMAIQIAIGIVLLVVSIMGNLILNKYLAITEDMSMPESFASIVDALKFTFRLVYPSLAIFLLGASIRVIFLLRCASRNRMG